MELAPQSATLSVDSGPLSGVADVLAGESPADEINEFKVVFSDFSHIAVSPYIGPMLLKNLRRVVIYFHLPPARHPRPFKAEVYAANASE